MVRCSRCHTVFTPKAGEEEPACPQCKAEAGLEPVKAVPGPMRAFGLVLAGVLLAVLAGDLLSRLSG